MSNSAVGNTACSTIENFGRQRAIDVTEMDLSEIVNFSKINLKSDPFGGIARCGGSFGMKDADDEPISVCGSQEKQIAGDCARGLQSVYLSGARTNLIFDLLVKMSDAANRASGLRIKRAAEATGLSEEEAYRCIQSIVSFTGDPIVIQNGERTWLYQNYEPRSIGGAAQGMSRLLPKLATDEAAARSRKRASSCHSLATGAANGAAAS